MIFVTRIDVTIVLPNIVDECQSMCTGNTMKITGNAKCGGGVIEDDNDDVDSDDYNDDDDHVVIWL